MDTIDENLLNGGNEGFLPNESIQYLAITRKWAKFLAILGFIFMGLMAIFGIFFAFSMSAAGAQSFGGSAIPGFAFTIFYLLIAAVYFFPIYYLYKFTSHMKVALIANNTQELNSAFKNLKSHYKFIGVSVIVFFSLYIIAMIVVFSFGMNMLNNF